MATFKCILCPRTSLVRSNFKFTPAGNCVCVVCWDGYNVAQPHDARRGVIEALGGMFAVCEELRIDPDAAS